MTVKTFAPMLLVVCALFTMVACDDDKNASAPSYWGFTYTPTTVHAGDSVTIKAVQRKKGQYLYSTTYNWSMRLTVVDSLYNVVDTTLSYKQTTNYDGTYNGDPTWNLKIPEGTTSSSATVSFSASWSNYADGEYVSTTTPSDRDAIYKGTITSSTYTLYSNASGSFTLPIAQ